MSDTLPPTISDVSSDQQSPPDPPPSPPSSALSGNGSPFTSDSEDESYPTDSFDHHIPRRPTASTLSRDREKCLLCGAQENLNVLRLVGPTSTITTTFIWMQCLNILPDDFHTSKAGCDHLSNLMTLCSKHAVAYLNSAWRFIPCKEDRKVMLEFEQEDQTRRSSILSATGELPKRSLPKLSNKFDAVVFIRPKMPLKDRRNPTEWLNLSLPVNPFLVFAASLDIANSTYWPPPTQEIMAIEKELRDLRHAYNAPLQP